MKTALNRHDSPEAITTDGLRRHRAAMNELGIAEKQELARWANNWVEKFAPAVSTTGADDAEVQADENATEVRLGACQRQQPLEPGAPPHRPPDLQGTTLRNARGVEDSRELGRRVQSPKCIVWRAVRVRLTSPPITIAK